jgi:hypothetical protein
LVVSDAAEFSGEAETAGAAVFAGSNATGAEYLAADPGVSSCDSVGVVGVSSICFSIVVRIAGVVSGRPAYASNSLDDSTACRPDTRFAAVIEVIS